MKLSAEILARFESHVHEAGLLFSGDKLILGISGGADSTALLYLFSRLRYSYRLSLLAVHINHQLRGENSLADEACVKKLCIRFNIPLIVRRIELEPGGDLENRARNLRFEIFESVRQAYKFDKIALGHHRWDQAETMLLNLIRGTGLSGLSGIKARQDFLIHPLLPFKPDELKELLTGQNIAWREDESNLQNIFARNRLRNELIPLVEQAYNPQFKEKLAESADIFYEADIYIRDRSQRRYKRLLLDASKERIYLNLEDLLKAPNIEQYYILRMAYQALSGVEQDFMRHSFLEIKGILQAEGSKYISLPRGIIVKKQYQELVFSKVPSDIRSETSESYILDTERNRAVYMDYRFSFKYLKVLPENYRELAPFTIFIDADKLKGTLAIRSRLAGDRFIPLGMSNMKKLKDFFIDEKVPKYDRDLIPIFVDDEKLVWICGQRLDDRVKIDVKSNRYLMISAEPLNQKPKRAANRKKRGINEFDEL